MTNVIKRYKLPVLFLVLALILAAPALTTNTPSLEASPLEPVHSASSAVVESTSDPDLGNNVRLQGGTVFNIDNGDTTGFINAIIAANSVPEGTVTINLFANGTYTFTQGYNGTTTALPTILYSVEIVGNGATIERSSDGGTPLFRLFSIAAEGWLNIGNVTVRNGDAGTEDGGAFYVNASGSLDITQSTISNNRAANGGAIYVGNSGTFSALNSNLQNNQATTGNGGFAYMFISSVGDISVSTVTNNTAALKGGAVFKAASTLHIDYATFENNSANDGGVVFNSGGAMDAVEATFIENQALAGNGGAIFNDQGVVDSNMGIFMDNTASADGGAVYHANSPTGLINIRNGCFVDNETSAIFNAYPEWPPTISALGNWWGSPEGPNDNNDGTSGDVILGNVLYTPASYVPILDCPYPDAATDTNLVQNGDFENGETDWTFEGDFVHSVSNGQLNFYLQTGNPNDAVISQEIPYSVPANAVLEMTFDLENTSSGDKELFIQLNAPNTEELSCYLVLPANSAMGKYTLRGRTTQAWINMIVEFNLPTRDSLGNMVLDNVDVQYKPAGSAGTGEATCGVPVIEETNLVSNGDFSNALTDWSIGGDVSATVVEEELNFVRDTSLGNGWALIVQSLSYTTTAGQPFEISVDLANPTGTAKDVGIYLHENGTWGKGALGCTFTIYPNSPLTTYTIQGTLPQAWLDITLEITPITADAPPNYLIIDNITVQYLPALGSPPNSCLSAPPTDTNLVQNGDFSDDTNHWAIAGDIDANVNAGVLNFVRDTSLGNGWSLILQNLNQSSPLGAPFQITVDLGNNSSTAKDVSVYLHENGTWENGTLGCVLTVLPNSPLATYTIQGTVPQAWSNITLEINSLDPGSAPDYLLMDNVNVQYKPSLGAIEDSCEGSLPTDTNLVRNGDFSSSTDNWAIAGDMQGTVISGALNFVRNSSLGNGWALILQTLDYATNSGLPFEVNIDLGNASGTPKYVTVYLHENGTWGQGTLGCLFSLQPNTPLGTYTVRGTLPQAWSNITLEVNTLSFSTAPDYILMDNVDVQHKPGLGNPPNECLTPLPADSNLVWNGDFSSGSNGWTTGGDMQTIVSSGALNFVRDPSLGQGWAMILQNLTYAAPAGSPFEITLDLGNDSSTTKYVTAYLHENGSWGLGALGCVFSVPPNSIPGTYTIRGMLPQAWSNVTLEFNSLSPDSPPNWLLLDNINVQYKPSLGSPSNECLTPLPVDTNLVQNGDFSSGTTNWTAAGDMVMIVNSGVLNFVRDTSLGNGWAFILQNLGYAAGASSPFEITLDLGNNSTTNKFVTVYLHENGTWGSGSLGCVFEVPGSSAPATYTIRGMLPQAWSNITLEFNALDADSPPNYLLLDNVNVQYRPSLGSPPDACIPPAPPLMASQSTIEEIRIEAEDTAFVTAAGGWIVHESDAASGGAYMYSGGETTDTLNLDFSGTHITIVYVQHPALGSFDVFIDGQLVGTVDLSGVQNFGERALFSGLSEGDHTLTIVPTVGVIAVDAFLVEGTPAQ